MPIITIREQGKTAEGFTAGVQIDQGPEYPVTITNPFTAEPEGAKPCAPTVSGSYTCTLS